MASTTLEVIIAGKDRFSPTAKSVGSSLAGLKRDASGLKGTILTGVGLGAGISLFGLAESAVRTLTGVLSDAVTKAKEEEASVARLARTLSENTPAFTGITQPLKDFVKAGQDLAFTDDAIRDSVGKLAVSTGSTSKALDLTRTAMDLARLKGIELSTSTDIIAKAYAGQIGPLRRLLPWLDKNADATETLAAIQKVASGQAKTYADTTEGRLVKAQIALDEAMEDLGETLLPLVGDLAEIASTILTTVAPAFEKLAQRVGDALAPIGDLADLVDELGIKTGLYRDGADEASLSTDILADALGNIISPFSQVRADTKLTSDEFETLKQKFMALEDTPTELGAALREGSPAVQEAAVELGNYLPEALDAAGREAVRLAKLLPGDLAQAIRDKRTTWQEAVDLLAQDFEDSMTVASEVAALKSALISTQVVEGLKSQDPVVKAQAEATTQVIISRLDELGANAYTYGVSTGNAYADGIYASRGRAEWAAKGVAGIVRTIFEAWSPPGPASPLHEIDVWGRRTGEAWAEGLASGVAGAMRTVTAGAASLAPVFGGGSMPAFAAAGGSFGGEQAIYTTVTLDGEVVGRQVDKYLRRRAGL